MIIVTKAEGKSGGCFRKPCKEISLCSFRLIVLSKLRGYFHGSEDGISRQLSGCRCCSFDLEDFTGVQMTIVTTNVRPIKIKQDQISVDKTLGEKMCSTIILANTLWDV
jgi:hypothetical protein